MIKKAEKLLGFILGCLVIWLCFCLYRGDFQKTSVEEMPIYNEYKLTEKELELPSRYDPRETGDIPEVKDQGPFGTCWAVAASSALEASLLPQEKIIFSAEHLALQNAFAKAKDLGGDSMMTMAYLTGWQGPVLEEDDPYGDGVSGEDLAPVKHVQEIQMLGDKDYDSIKRAVYQYGAVQSSIYMDMENASSTSVYYNQLEHSYYYNGTGKANHDILIIGWDDVYSPERFNVETKKSGAFICQNSWGTEFGENGIFYISYEDVHIGVKGVVYTSIEEPDNYDHLYQTDLCGWVGQVGYGDGICWFSNVYRIDGEENLEAVGFYALDKNTQFQVYVAERQDEIQNFLLEDPVAAGKIENPGYYTVSFEQPVELEAAKEYIVAVKIDTPDTQYPVAMEYAANESTKTVDILDGEGYISHNGVNWTRTEIAHGANVCLKAYTSDRG